MARNLPSLSEHFFPQYGGYFHEPEVWVLFVCLLACLLAQGFCCIGISEVVCAFSSLSHFVGEGMYGVSWMALGQRQTGRRWSLLRGPSQLTEGCAGRMKDKQA